MRSGFALQFELSQYIGQFATRVFLHQRRRKNARAVKFDICLWTQYWLSFTHPQKSPGFEKEFTSKLVSELRGEFASQTFTAHRADMSNREETQGLITSVLAAHTQRHDSIAILVLNAGLARRIRDIEEISLQDWDDVIQVNCTSPFVLLKNSLDDLGGKMRKARWGRIILIGSISSRGGGINGCHYAASKGALCSMGMNLARVLAPDNITVNCISPALIGDTGMVPAVQPPSQDLSSNDQPHTQLDIGTVLASTIPLGRLGHPSEVANVVVMLAKTGYMTGQEIVLGGGLH
ncbi:hypothetical protein PGT21_006971 [Puccinia graminis f. sp. tritici]|uniref:Uncharacterized protein n=1 Tax=Puccinia graminis f. sp. tritici TaxID=56615 RepID=A0A5B0QWY5_PUCGR|nr:hypothetical protein PGT21_006971 [Puccinia graminis f. sp. tritici]